MCDNPQEKDGRTFACRTCDACIAARRSNWVARAMAETTQHQHALCVTLTYDDKAPGGYDAARFFAYYDVRALVQRITAALRRIDKTLSVRFLCAGEQGDQNARCHWHLILWSDYDLRTLGEVTLRGKTISDPETMMSVGKRKRRLHWSLWARDKHPLGFVTFGAADEAGVKYVVSYCLKDQFTTAKSEGKARFTKSENFATGLFRMSKRPGLGEAWLMQKVQALDDASAVLPNTNLKVPGMQPGRYWYPSGTMRRNLLLAMRAINDKRHAADLGDAPQWPGLLASCKDNPSDLEILTSEAQKAFSDHVRAYQDHGDALAHIRAKQIDLTHRGQARAKAFNRLWVVLCDDCVSQTENRRLYGDVVWNRVHETFWRAALRNGEQTPSRGAITDALGETPYCEGCSECKPGIVYALPRPNKAA